MGRGERVSVRAFSWPDDERSIDGSSVEGDMGMPPECALLTYNVELICIFVTGLYRALGYHVGPIGPSA